MKQGSFGIQFNLDSGRIVNVDLLTIETKYKNVIADSQADVELSLLIKRRVMDVQENQWTDGADIHFIFPEDLSEVSSADNFVLVSAVLWSEPITEGFGFSELMVVFYAEYRKELSIEQMLQEGLHDLAWDELAIDRNGAVSKA